MDSRLPRDITAVIPQMLQIIPDDEHHLRIQLKAYSSSLFNQSPEARRTAYVWLPLQNILQKNITTFDAEWKLQLLALFNDM
jgi:hypothetical protein